MSERLIDLDKVQYVLDNVNELATPSFRDTLFDLCSAALHAHSLHAILSEWNEDGACGCDTFTCQDICLPARTRSALAKFRIDQ